MINGLVSNCWNWQLNNGESLVDLIQQAQNRGLNYVELRQHSLGEFESDGIPIQDRFQELGRQFSSFDFDLAIAVPFLNPTVVLSELSLLATSLEACIQLAANGKPHLRLVDLSTSEADSRSLNPGDCAKSIANTAELLSRHDGILSIEHSIQSWNLFRSTFDAARELLSSRNVDPTVLRICFDPCNLLLLKEEHLDPAQVTRTLSSDELSMIHFKQRIDGAPSNGLTDGEIDWAQVESAINERNLNVPWLLEIPSTEQIWEHVEQSQQYLHRLR
jgi:sugar phosphate isomerase/epimerase